MAISTTLIGKLGGIETQETRIDDNTTTTIPAGWRKAAGVFRGQMVYGMSNGTVFGTSLRPIVSGDTVPVNGGGGAHSRRQNQFPQRVGHSHLVPAGVARGAVV